MDKSTAQRVVSQTFKATFDRDRFRNFVNELTNGFDESKKQTMQIPDAFKPHVTSCQRIGTYESPEHELADVLIVHLTESYKLERTRTALRDFVAHKLKRGDGEDNAYKEAALVAFVAPDAKSWRFSFVRMEYETKRDPKTGRIKPEERLTPARRYSYLVGAEEECHTAQARFLDLLKDTTTKPSLAKIEEAFSVESVTKEFFDKYAALFQRTHAALESIIAKDKVVRADFQAKGVCTVDFAKKLLGQIVFLYFIQKKGWLGVPNGGKWGDGPKNFMRQLAARSIADGKCLFNEVLEPLFYDTLATDRGHEAWCKPFSCRIPFLNGGLFEPISGYDWQSTNLAFSNDLFTNSDPTKEGDTGTGILDVFDRYNFTVNEAEPLEKEVAIDPEMLGKVFENLIEENRRKGLGAYYTPREIVHYMCQESLINYLDTTLNPESSEVPRADIETFIREGDQAAHYETARKGGTVSYARKLSRSIETHASALDEALKSITVCDPAIGSGAFPVGMMTEIVKARTALTPYFNDVADRTPYHFKRHAIQNSIYGVDIDAGAVEIAKLRLWLSLVVDEEDITQIKTLPNLDYKIVVGNSLLGVEKNLFNIEAFNKLERLKPQFFDSSDHAEKSVLKQQIEETIHELTAGKEAFDFEIYFSELFNLKGGFDVAIANPPYVSYYSRHAQQIDHRYLSQLLSRFVFPHEPLAGKRYHSAMFFLERAASLVAPRGTVTFIVDMNLFEDAFAGIRQHLIKHHALAYLVRGLNHFENVNSGQVILQFAKLLPQADHSFLLRNGLDYEGAAVNQHACRADVKCRFILPEIQTFEDTLPLSELGTVNTGVNIGGASETFLSSSQKTKEFIPFISTTTLKVKYQPIRHQGEFICFSQSLVEEVNRKNRERGSKNVVVLGNSERFKGEKLIIRQSAPEIVATHDNQVSATPYSIFVFNLKPERAKSFRLKYILAVLNSKFITYYALKNQIIRVGEGKQPQIRKSGLDIIPIKRISITEQERFVELVDQILAAKQNDAKTNTSALELEVDELVYGIYSLTPEEIQIVEALAK